MERLLKVNEVAERTGLGRTLIYELISRHELASVNIGRTRRIREADLDAFIRERSAESLSLAAAS